MKKNVGTRTRPTVRTPEQRRKHRAEQAARAILAGRGNREANWTRIERHLVDVKTKPSDFCGLEIPEPIEERLWPEPVVETAPEIVEEIGTLVADPIFGEVLEIDLDPLPVAETTA